MAYFEGRLESVRIGKCQNPFFAHFEQKWKVSELESVRIGKCQNWKLSETAQFGKCQNWKVSESAWTLSNLSSF